MDVLDFLSEHRATLSELCEPFIIELREEFEVLNPSFRDELIEDFQRECKLEIAEYIAFNLGIDYVHIQEVLEEVDMLTFLDLNV